MASSAIATPWSNNPWSLASAVPQTNVIPQPGTEWPGAITTDHGQDDSYGDHAAVIAAYGINHPSPSTAQAANDFLTDNIEIVDDGTGYVPSGEHYLNHDVDYPVWDSSAGKPFAPSGAISGIHAEGTGSSPKFVQTPADIGNPVDLRIASQSYAPAYSWDSATGERNNAPTQWVAHDQAQDVNGSGIDYAPRQFFQNEINAVSPNLAAVSQPFIADSGYTQLGLTPDMAARDYASVLYSAPADPVVTESQPAATAPGVAEGDVW